MKRKLAAGVAGVVGAFGWATATFAQAPVATSAPHGAAVTAADRANDDARQKLVEAVLGAPCQVTTTGATQTVASLLAFFPRADVELRRGICGEAKTGRPRQTQPGVVAVDASLATARINELLTQAVAQPEGGGAVGPIQLEPSVGPAVAATGTAAEDGAPRAHWPGWRHCGREDLEIALEAARLDLRNRLLLLLTRVPLANGQTVGQLARQNPQVAESLRAQVDWINGSEPAYAPEGLCVVKATVSAGQVETMASAAFRAAGLGSDAANRPEVPTGSFELEGMSVTPPQAAARARPGRAPRPAWYEQTLSKTASAAGPADDPDVAFRNRLAIKAATVEARRQLWTELETLALPDGRNVAQAIAGHPDHDALIRDIDAAVFQLATPSVTDEGVATVKLGLPLDKVWQSITSGG